MWGWGGWVGVSTFSHRVRVEVGIAKDGGSHPRVGGQIVGDRQLGLDQFVKEHSAALVDLRGGGE